MSYLLECYDHLDGSLQQAWALLVRGSVDRRSPFHTPVVATTGADGAPAARTVVLRSADPEHWTLAFHTDARSRKFAELEREARVSLVGYDPGSKVQLRCQGTATRHSGEANAAVAWGRSRDQSKACYRQAAAPGTPLGDPRAIGPPLDDEAADPAAGFQNFVQVVVAVREIEWLYLAHAGHRRARFTRLPDGSVDRCWLAP